jgi:hypothetical protein
VHKDCPNAIECNPTTLLTESCLPNGSTDSSQEEFKAIINVTGMDVMDWQTVN